MPQPFTKWTVLSHGPLNPIASDILTVEGAIPMPVGNLTRRMTVVRLRDGRLVIFSPIALDEAEMRRLEDFGKPAFLVVPNDHHRLDARVWKDRYPAIQVVAPEGARAKVEEIVPVDAAHPQLDDSDVSLVTVPGTGKREFALEVRGPDGTTLVLNDVVGNVHRTSGIGGWFLRLMRFAGNKPHVPTPVKMAMIEDKAALARQFELWAELPSLKRVLVSHGEPIEENPKAALQELAATLH